MKYLTFLAVALFTCVSLSSGADLAGSGEVEVKGERKLWHKITFDLEGPHAKETGGSYNPFTDCRMTLTLKHESGHPVYQIPGYFAADGAAAETSAAEGRIWRAHFRPDRTGTWHYRIHFAKGPMAAIDSSNLEPLHPYDGLTGTIKVTESDKTGRDFRARGRLEYVGERYLRFRGDETYFLKAGPDAPETFLAYEDFDNTVQTIEKGPLKSWEAHIRDWKVGDPTWAGDRGKGMIGALNYLSGKGMNAFSFLTYNAGGDGDNVWPFVERDDKFRYDVSKLDQWGIIFEHAQEKGLYLHFKLQENELDDHREKRERKVVEIPEAMDAGLMGPERKLYFRELVARFGHNLALNWNLGEENSQTYEEQEDMAGWLKEIDPYNHPIVIHTFPSEQEQVYMPLLGPGSALTGASLQNGWSLAHEKTLQWVRASALAGKQWVVANDEQGPAMFGVPPDPGYAGFSGVVEPENQQSYDLHDIRKYTLWGNLMAGGAGVEYYFGYQLPENDLLAEDYRSRDASWDYCRIALQFFRDANIPFWRMDNHNELIGNPENDNSRYCLAQPQRLYLIYLPEGQTTQLDLGGFAGKLRIRWFNPREGGNPQKGTVDSVEAGGLVNVGFPPADNAEDWLVVVERLEN